MTKEMIRKFKISVRLLTNGAMGVAFVATLIKAGFEHHMSSGIIACVWLFLFVNSFAELVMNFLLSKTKVIE
ncbi:MAG: hypothetical protein Q8910_00120 [Bacteroidota bacterium]|nr:hypothetical protein [Bacteroidota bacterium]